MTHAAPRARGGCLCGGVRFEVRGALRDVIVCHCGQCRRSHGHVAAYSAAAPGDLYFLADATLTWFRSSERARRGFCNNCGSSLFWEPADKSRLAVAAGCLDRPTGLKAVRQIFTDDAGDYYALDAGLPGDPGSHYRGQKGS